MNENVSVASYGFLKLFYLKNIVGICKTTGHHLILNRFYKVCDSTSQVSVHFNKPVLVETLEIFASVSPLK